MIAHFSTITYAYDKGKNTFPSKLNMEKELEIYTDIMLDICFGNLSLFQGWEVKKGKIDTEVSIAENSVVFNINYPIEFKREQIFKEFSKFRAEVPVRLGHIHSIITNIVQEQVEQSGWIPFTYLNEFDVNVTFYPYRENNFIYEFIDEKSLIRNEPYRFLVANKFEEVDLSEIV